MITIINDDAVKWANDYTGELFHAMFCDAPYHLASSKSGKKGFMGKSWDGGNVSFRVETWEAFKKVLYPGAFGMAFGGARTAHRMAVAIEDAGFIIHPQIAWANSAGFPKSTRIDTQIDKAAKVEREITGYESDGSGRRNKRNNEQGYRPNVYSSGDLVTFPVTRPSTPMAQVWSEHRYGLQALKPAVEPIIVFQKPYAGKPVDCIVETGAGALWIDGTRIPITERDVKAFERLVGYNGIVSIGGNGILGGGKDVDRGEYKPTGRWPANFVLSHSYECEYTKRGWICVDTCPVKRLGEQSGERSVGNSKNKTAINDNGKRGEFRYSPSSSLPTTSYADKGTASRFFYNADYMYERLEESDQFIYQAKASRKERESGLDNFEKKFSATMGDGIEEREHNPDEPNAHVRNVHPTVKPIALARHLATLLLPPSHYSPRRLFIPFAGVASECIGANLAGWEQVTGVELEQEYCEIGTARAKYWTLERAASIINKKKLTKDNQLKMF